jgi:hypothetical protein
MNNYLEKYDSMNKIIIYNFELGLGGIGDCLKFFLYLLQMCIKYKIKLYYLKNDLYIEKYLKLKYEKMYINRSNDFIPITPNKIECLIENTYYIINPISFYEYFSYDDIQKTIPLQDIFYFSPEVIVNANSFHLNRYISIHLRLGDKYLETDKSFVLCKEDVRSYNETKLFDFIEENNDKTILFFCDNHSYKLKIKNKYSFVNITDYEIGHTSLSNTTELQTLNSLTDFYLLTNSTEIFVASHSGFSIMASKFKNIPLFEL